MAARAASSSRFSTTAFIQSPKRFISSAPIPRLVRAGVPIRIPLGSNGLRGSNGTLFALQTMPAASKARAACLPDTFLLVRSMRLSGCLCSGNEVKTVTLKLLSQDLTVLTTCWAWVRYRLLHQGRQLELQSCDCEDPCIPGNTARSIFLARPSRHIIIPPRGPRAFCELWS